MYYPPAQHMEPEQISLYLQRANAYALGVIGGVPVYDLLPLEQRVMYQNAAKAGVALAFECLAKGETAQVNPYNGDITEAAPAGYFQRSSNRSQQWETVDKILRPVMDLYVSQITIIEVPDNGVQFL